MSSALAKLKTSSLNRRVTVALSPGLSAGVPPHVEEQVVLSMTEKLNVPKGRRVSTSKLEVIAVSPVLPTWSVQVSLSEIVLLGTSLLLVGVNVPVHLVPPLLVLIFESVPVALSRLMSLELEKEEEVTGSGKSRVSVAVCPYKINDGLDRVKVGVPFSPGNISSTI